MDELSVDKIMATDLVTLEEDEDLAIADTIMNLARIRHLPVVQDGRLVGLITHRDLLRAQVSLFADLSPTESDQLKRQILAGDIMTRDVRTVTPDTPVLDVAKQMFRRKIGCVPVVDGERLVGIVTEADFVRLVIDGLEHERRLARDGD